MIITAVQCNYTCRLIIWWTKISSRKSSQKTRHYLNSKKLSGSTCLFTTNFQWSKSGPWRRKTSKSWGSSRTSCPKGAYQTEHISSTFWTRSSHNMWRRLFGTQIISETPRKRRLKQDKQSKSRTTGGTPSMQCRSFLVSTSLPLW